MLVVVDHTLNERTQLVVVALVILILMSDSAVLTVTLNGGYKLLQVSVLLNKPTLEEVLEPLDLSHGIAQNIY